MTSMMTRKAYPSDNATWQDALNLIESLGLKTPSDEACIYLDCTPAEVMAVVDDADVFLCAYHAGEGDFENEFKNNVTNIWTGKEWDAWENPLDFPEDIKR